MIETDILSDYIDDVRNVFETTESPIEQGEQVATLTADVLAEDSWLDDEIDSLGGAVGASITSMVA